MSRKRERLQWCDYEREDFPESQFMDSEYGKLHLVRPLHNTAGQRGGSEFDFVLAAPTRLRLEEKLGGEKPLNDLLQDG